MRKSLIIRRAGDETRTRDIFLGKEVLYQLSYTRAEGGKVKAIKAACKKFPAFGLPPVLSEKSTRMSNRLQEILDHKKTEIAKLLPRAGKLRAAALLREDFRGFASAIGRGHDALGLIAEVKKASPSVGTIVESFDPVAIAKTYQSAGAHAVSVLTDEKFFHGHLSDLTKVRAAISLPVLRKDFILHEAQIFEAACAGADAILLIVAALDQPQLEALRRTANDFQLDALVEVHTMQ